MHTRAQRLRQREKPLAEETWRAAYAEIQHSRSLCHAAGDRLPSPRNTPESSVAAIGRHRTSRQPPSPGLSTPGYTEGSHATEKKLHKRAASAMSHECPQQQYQQPLERQQAARSRAARVTGIVARPCRGGWCSSVAENAPHRRRGNGAGPAAAHASICLRAAP